MNRTSLACSLATLVVAGVYVAQAAAHPASVACGPDGPVVSAPPWHGATASVTTNGGIASVVWSDGYRLSLTLPASCPGPPVPDTPASPPVPVPPEVAPPAPVRVTCADLTAKRAGVRWLREYGCAVPRARKVTCAWLRARHAGPRSYTRLGFYPGCKAPVPVTPRRIAVAG